jgi:hypothetical protein
MASSGCRARVSFLLVLLGIAAVAGCADRAAAPTARDTAPADPGIDLPAGPGRDLLLARCLGCHDLGGLELFGSFYTRDDWHQLLETMVAHGARLDSAEVELVADYLGLHYSPGP